MWIQKCAQLVGAYMQKDWDLCSRLCDEYCRHNMLATIVARIVTAMAESQHHTLPSSPSSSA